ncbi:MAG TPA: DUF2637 domain-containing protein [Streptosporangiaceae bacterium]
MSAYLPPSARRGFRIAALIAAVICVLAIAAGAFVVSYTGVRDLALTAGVTAHYARFYPWIFDAVFVVAAVAALSLRGALRAYAWLAILVILGAVATADAIHATAIALPKRPAEATVAAAPWAVLLIGFTLLYAMVRQALPARRAAAAASPTSNGRVDNGGQAAPVPLSALLADKPATRPERAQAALTARAATATATATKPSPPARAEPVPPKTEPLTTKTKPAPRTEPAITKTEPVPPKTVPVIAKAEPAPRTEPITTKTEPVIAGPASTEPASAEPINTEPTSAEPASTEPASTEPVSAETGPAAPAPPPAPEPVSTPADPYPARTQQFAVRRPPMAAWPVAEPELPARQPAERDDPSDADAEPVEPTTHFNRLRSGPTPPDED